MSVASILVDAINSGGGRKRAQATVSIVDDQGNQVANATVTGDFRGDFNEPGLSQDTDGSGAALFTGSDTKKGRTTFEFCVTGVTHDTLDPLLDEVCAPY